MLAPNDPLVIEPDRRLEGPSGDFPLGTDHLGRCVLSRLVYGARWSLGTAAVASVLIVGVGVTLGAMSGFYRGPVDAVLMRVVDVLLAFPALIPALAIVGMLGPGMLHVLIATVAVWWASYARLVRGLALSLRERQFIEAARALGAGDLRIISRQLLPNLLPPVLVLASVEMGSLVLAMAGLSFLGLGAQPPTPEWGAMLNDGRAYLLTAPQLMIYPGLAISLAVIGFNLVGEGVRDLLDPRIAGSAR
ncbi:MAG: ABC transporter permease subunit [Gemmatimonadales bacterium]|nr:ABC transporter permease subunit [Gemmatimonadales bacterium]